MPIKFGMQDNDNNNWKKKTYKYTTHHMCNIEKINSKIKKISLDVTPPRSVRGYANDSHVITRAQKRRLQHATETTPLD